MRRPKDSRGENSAHFLYSIYYARFTRRIYELGKEKKVYLSWLPFTGATGPEPPQISFKQEASGSLLQPRQIL